MPASDRSTDGGSFPETRIRRILVALDSATAGGTTLEIAADLAAAQACELSGLFIEDQDLLHLAELPFAREIQLGKAISRALAPELLLQDLRAQAALARSATQRQAERCRLSWSFQVTRGRGEEAVLLAAAAGDMIAIARGFGALAQIGRLSRRLRLIAVRAPGPILLTGEPAVSRSGPVLLPYDASPAARSMLAIAADLARARRQVLEILLLGDAAGTENLVADRLRATAAGRPLPTLRFWTPRDCAAALRRLLDADRGLLVLPVDATCFSPEEVERVIERTRLPVVLQAEAADGKP